MADKVEQLEFPDENQTAQTGPVTCLGMTFENDEARRAYFTEELRKKLPELRKIEGFPIGEDEDILALSDPPYYTACPNPWIKDFVKEWESSKPEKLDEQHYRREPFTADVSEGKNDPIYNAHSYHTKVPHKAIMRYILHYTEPGDIVFDGFCGTGMTGVAAQMCGHRSEIMSLGYSINSSGEVMDSSGNLISKIGERNVILNDLSPAATFLSYNYNSRVDLNKFDKNVKKIINEVKKEWNWLLETDHLLPDGNSAKGEINYIVWSDVFICPSCLEEVIYWDVAMQKDTGKVLDEFYCNHCKALLNKKSVERSWISFFDDCLQMTVKQPKQVPVLINYSYGNRRFFKAPDVSDLSLIDKINDTPIPYWYPVTKMPEGDESSRNDKIGITHIHHYFTKRNLLLISALLHKASRLEPRDRKAFLGILTGILQISSKQSSFRFDSRNPENTAGGILKGTWYIPSIIREGSVFQNFERRYASFQKLYQTNHDFQSDFSVITTSTASDILINDNSIDYIFVDPPFGANIMYSELNILWESWLGIKTNVTDEAIINNSQRKKLNEYKNIMLKCFREFYRILKPNHWMTIEFSNSKASVWNSIREALEQAGFIIANVSALDKQQGSFKAVTTTTAVRQDLVISAYKPNSELVKNVERTKNTSDSIWNFIKYHLEQLPVFLGEKDSAGVVVERTPRILFDRMVAFHVQNGYSVPISSAEFQTEITQRFPMRDGMVFLESQVAEYDKKRIQAKDFVQLSLFVSDENSAIEWLRQQLLKKPQTRQDLHPNFMKEIQHIAKHEKLPELDDLLEQNFLKYDGEGEVPSQIHAYLSSDYKDLRGLDKNDPKLKEKAKNRWYVPDPNKQADLEKLREKSLLREFNQYVEELSNSKKKLKQFRTEAIRVGFYKAWTEKNYQLIVDIGNRLPESILQEDEKLLRYYDNAQTKLGL
ncbi:DNA methylase [Brevibacillus panacihumi W25]|uniref:DNA methylase n=1 Tax=Brevibacillus panacihumi W25 TaxID=1408254 RepID=V6MD56_9BACL|nr:DNA methyltransferase [Brevibacillus panacihumi]EST56476.1 DNA methylase [Brevibacillus panacihumi W25]